MPDNCVIVRDIAGKYARIKNNNKNYKDYFLSLGFMPDGDQLSREIIDDDDRIEIIKKLIEVGALFSSGRGWSPEDILAMYSEKGLVNKNYLVISWKDPENYFIKEVKL